MKNDRKALFEIRFKKYYPRLCSIACGYVSETETSEDIVQGLSSLYGIAKKMLYLNLNFIFI